MTWTQAKENHLVNSGLAPFPYPYITGLKLEGNIAINGLTLNTIDVDDVVWVCTDIKGWWQHPDTEFPEITRGYTDGSYDVLGRYQARQITLEGSILVTDSSKVPAARNKLIRAVNLVKTGGWLVVGNNPAMASWVRLSGRPEIETVNSRGRTDFSIGLRAADPVKYSWNPSDPLGEGYTLTTFTALTPSIRSRTVTINNAGNYDSHVYLEIAGGITGPATITNSTTNQTITVVENVAIDKVLQIDTYERLVAESNVYNGARAKLSTLVDWIYLRPGNNTITFTSNTGVLPSLLKFYHRSGWIA